MRKLLISCISGTVLIATTGALPAQDLPERLPLPRGTGQQVRVIAGDANLAPRIQQTTTNALSSRITMSERAETRATLAQAIDYTKSTSAEISRRNTITLGAQTVITVLGSWGDKTHPFPVASSLATVANAHLGYLADSRNSEARMRSGGLVYRAITRSGDEFRVEAEAIINAHGASSDEGQRRLNDLIERQRGAVVQFFDEGELAGLDSNLRNAMIAQGTRAMLDVIIRQGSASAAATAELASRVDGGIAHAKAAKEAIDGARDAIGQVYEQVDLVGNHIQTMNAGLSTLIQKQFTAAAQDRLNGEAISFVLEATMGQLPLNRQVRMLRDGHPAGMDSDLRSKLLDSAEKAERVERSLEGARRFGDHLQTAGKVATAFATLARFVGDEDTGRAIANFQKNLAIGQTVVNTYAAAAVAFASGGILAAGFAVVGGLDGLGLGGGPADANEAMMAEVRELFGQVFRELEKINAKLDAIIEGQQAIMQQLRDLGTQLAGVEERLSWQIRRVGDQLAYLTDVVVDLPGVGQRNLWSSCYAMMSGDHSNLLSIPGFTIQDSGHSYRSKEINFSSLNSRSEYFTKIIGPRSRNNFAQCENFLITLTMPMISGGAVGEPHSFLRASSWFPQTELSQAQASAELSSPYFETALQTTLRLLGEPDGGWCASRFLGVLGFGPTTFRGINWDQLSCPVGTHTPALPPLIALHNQRLSARAIEDVARAILFMGEFYAFETGNGDQRRILTGDEVARILSSGEELPPPRDILATFQSGHLLTLEVGIAQEGVLAGAGLANMFREYLVPAFDPSMPVDSLLPVPPLGDSFWHGTMVRKALLAKEQAVSDALSKLDEAKRNLAKQLAVSPQIPADVTTARERREAAEAELQGIQRARWEGRTAPTAAPGQPASPIDQDTAILNFIATGSEIAPRLDPMRDPAAQRCRAAVTQGQGQSPHWARIQADYMVPMIGCLFRLYPKWASNFVRKLVLDTLSARGTSVEEYSLFYSSPANSLMKEILRGLPIERVLSVPDQLEYGGTWVMLIRDENGGVMRVRLPTPPEVVTQAIDLPAAMSGLLAARDRLLNELMSASVSTEGPHALDRALVYQAAAQTVDRRRAQRE